MHEEISYVIVTPYTIAKSRTGGVLSRLLSRVDLEFVGAQIFAPDREFVANYAELLRAQIDPANPKAAELLASYVEKNLGPSQGRRHRSLLLLFRGEDACRKLSDICGAMYPENRGEESITGETIRDTYADLIYDPVDPSKVIYFEPAIFTPRTQDLSDSHLKIIGEFIAREANIIENIVYPRNSDIQRTLVILKPDNWKAASSRPGAVIDMFSRTGLRIVGTKVHRFSVAQALEFYGPVKDILIQKLSPIFGGKARNMLEEGLNLQLNKEAAHCLEQTIGREYAIEQFNQIIEFMSGTRPDACPQELLHEGGGVKCMILIYEGTQAIEKIREVLGPTDPLKAPTGTIRREFGSNVMVNTAHASDSVENAKREMDIVQIDKNPCAQIIAHYLGQIH